MEVIYPFHYHSTVFTGDQVWEFRGQPKRDIQAVRERVRQRITRQERYLVSKLSKWKSMTGLGDKPGL